MDGKKIAIVILSILVVILAAAVGLLLYKDGFFSSPPIRAVPVVGQSNVPQPTTAEPDLTVTPSFELATH